MPRAIDGTRRKNRRKKILARAKGFRGARGKLFRAAKDAIGKAEQYAYRDRKVRKRAFRRLWIARLSAACRINGVRYSRFMNRLAHANISLNRKELSNLAIENPTAFANLVNQVEKQ